MGMLNRRIAIQVGPGINARPCLKNNRSTWVGCQWLIPVILPTQEAEIRISAWVNSSMIPYQKKKKPSPKRAGRLWLKV
jgi:hypothetical protein